MNESNSSDSAKSKTKIGKTRLFLIYPIHASIIDFTPFWKKKLSMCRWQSVPRVIEACGDGHQRGTTSPCEKCPVGTYRTAELQDFCVPCPNNLTTVKAGATTEDECIKGKYNVPFCLKLILCVWELYLTRWAMCSTCNFSIHSKWKTKWDQLEHSEHWC